MSSQARLRPDPKTGKLALLSPERLLFLNESAAAILALLDGKRTVTEVVAVLAARFQRPPAELAIEVCSYLDQLHERRLIEAVRP